LQAVHPPADLFLSVGGLEEDQLPGFRKITGILQERNYRHLRLFAQILEGEKHSSGVLAKTFLYGLRTIFRS
jgi:hypothetical protein